MTASIGGLGSGLDINGIVDQLIQIEKQGQTRIVNRRSGVQAQLDELGRVKSSISALSTVAAGLEKPTSWNAFSTSTSDNTVATATASTSATSGSLSFTVNQLAVAAAMRSTNTIASTNTVIASGNLLLAKGGHALGFATLTSESSLPVGKFDIRVTQSSAAASRTATSSLASAPITITEGVNDTIEVNINGSPTTITVAAGEYSHADLAQAITDASGGDLTASVAPTTGRLTLKTTAEGSDASLEVTGGSARETLGLAVDVSAATGVDGKVKVGDTETTISSITAGGTATLDAETGAITATLSGGLRVGTISARNVSVGTGTLSSVVNAINQANAGVTAAAVKVGTDAYRLQLGSTTAGSAGRLNLDTNAFTGIGGLTTINAGTDAQITVGSGDGAYTINSSTNDITGVLPGVTIALKKQSTDPITIAVNQDVNGLADKVGALINAANSAIDTIQRESSYNASTKRGGPLSGMGTMRSVVSAITQAVVNTVSGSTLSAGNQVGISVSRDGNIAFNRSKFLEAYTNDSQAVVRLFTRGGSATDSNIAFKDSLSRTKAGTYAVSVTTAATTATAEGTTVSGGAITGAETIDVKLGSAQATYAASAGESLSDIAAGLNAALGAANIKVSASVSENKLVLVANSAGTAGTFSVRSTVNGEGQTGIVTSTDAWEERAGVNIAGTIGGKTATGSGNTLTVSTTDATIPGLALTIDGSDTGSRGNFTYAPGIAARLTLAAFSLTDSAVGTLTSAQNGAKTTISRLDKEIDAWDRRLSDRQARLKAQYATLDTTLGSLRSQSSWLASQIAGLG